MMSVLSQNIFGQNSIKITGKVSFLQDDELAYGANIETYNNFIQIDFRESTFSIFTNFFANFDQKTSKFSVGSLRSPP